MVAADPGRPETLAEAISLLRAGEPVAFPTETVYGLGADALNGEAVARIYRAKGRPADNPLIVHVADLAMAEALAAPLPPVLEALAEAFWPGPLTVVLPKRPAIPDITSGGLATVALRVPDHPLALALIAGASLPVAAPSANLSGRPSPTTARHVYDDLQGRIPLILDGGPVSIGLESTVLDLSGAAPAILRPGKVTAADLAPFVPNLNRGPAAVETERPRSPGMKYSHYAPKGDLLIVAWEDLETLPERFAAAAGRKALLLSDEGWRRIAGDVGPDLLLRLGSRHDLSGVAQKLFAALRECDRLGMDTIYIEAFPSEGLGIALMNRIEKAGRYLG